ncbi:dTDP-4-dehydrorhamnose 3,5-epimerase [Cecembia calidifontis]|jgi:dTDP-4-dehydrorhamnose 3,5-epimerase|uniref:dTDP-4-dehydrorhamnose 3,5-epimerase n=1 Tax=Cecembia calidifontis TaxID=1187080 RepID=A0A4Q7P9Q2_9BACT|nr:dTDP-4-dehydrorhamnose 3,5-epimerase [Cecembia calidifontis]RZS96966.1 dTDP-4-dehydrorhamnose 3,5-epimerase [Cecembia calidifontis]
MIFRETSLKGAFEIEVNKIEDERGFFGRLWCENELKAHGLNVDIKQINVSFSKKKGTLRGLHFQKPPFQECKLIKCTKGAIFDVVVDLRPFSPTYKKWHGVELSGENQKMLYVPTDFAHGFITLEENTEVMFFVSQFYTPQAESGIKWNDDSINIKWPLKPKIISEKDSAFPDFSSFEINI